MSERQIVIAETSRGLGYEAELALDGLTHVIDVCNGALPALFQTEDYARSVITWLHENGAYSDPETLATEPSNRHKRNEAFWDDPDVNSTIVLPAGSLYIMVGSPDITRGAIENLAEALETAGMSGLNQAVALHRRQPGDPYNSGTSLGTGSYKVTTSHENGRRVWIGDSTVLAPEGSIPNRVYPQLAGLAIAAALPRDQALVEIGNALTFWAKR